MTDAIISHEHERQIDPPDQTTLSTQGYDTAFGTELRGNGGDGLAVMFPEDTEEPSGPQDKSSDGPDHSQGREESWSLAEVISLYEMIVTGQQGPRERNKALRHLKEALEYRVADHTRELRETNEELRRRIDGLRTEHETRSRMLKVSAEVVQAVPAGLFLFQYQPPGELFFLNGNPEAARLTAMGNQDYRGVELDEIWPNARIQGLTEAFLQAARTGNSFEADKAYFRNSRTERFFKVSAFSIPGDRLGVAFLDVTDQRIHEEAVRKAQSEIDNIIRERTADLVSDNQRLEEENSRLKQSKAMALQACRLRAQAELAADSVRLLNRRCEVIEEASGRALARLESGYISLVKQSLEQIQDAASEISVIVTRLRQFAGISPAMRLAQQRVIDLSELARQRAEAVLDGANAVGQTTNLVYELILDPECYVKAEEQDLKDVLDILLENANQASAPAGKVTLRTFTEGVWAVLEVSDHGVGIPESDVSKVFDPFWTSNAAHNGLGLAAASGIVGRHDGEVQVTVDSGVGTSFFVRLPKQEKP